MDPLSIIGSVVGITMAALQSIQFLAITINNVKDAPDTIRAISTYLHAIQPVLQNLSKALQGRSSQVALSNHIKLAVENCDRACKGFRSQVEHWTKNSTGDKMFWMDRWKVGLFGPERIKTFRGQLSDYKGTLSIALNTATVLTTSRQESLMQEMKDMMLHHNEVLVRQQISRADAEIREIEEMQQSVQTFTVDRSSDLVHIAQQSTESEQSRQELLLELASQKAANNNFKEMCEEALSQTIYERTGQKIKGVKATNNSSALTGFINTSGEELRIYQDISDVSADHWSIAVAGVIKNVDFKDLRPVGLGRGGQDDSRRS
ncbi:hypothetical protein BKA66DRAFT_298745 [Pyrenochaeta sp. MPI-SDFR-AT-0127]|nr:hypothetical protein BKA66DRAFT_298745 [Pyrenochaeta sp. MPI-SDFR-AT-0127]